MDSTTVLIDEFGNTFLDLSKEGTPTHFIYTSISFKTEDTELFEVARNRVCLDNKLSDNLRGNSKALGEKFFERRLKILKELNKLNFSIDVLVIDKSKILSDGLNYKRSFYKFFQSTFARKHFDRYDECLITAEKVGEGDFVLELQDFIRKRAFELDLFTPIREFKLSGKEEKLLQIVDFISNCIGKIFCTSHFHERSAEIWDIISARTSVSYFPFIAEPKFKHNISNLKVDSEIWKISTETIEQYKDKHQDNSDKLRTLLFLHTQSYVQPERFVPTYEILDYLSRFINDINEERIRRIIRDLRYDGLFIVSQSGKGGYKVATCYADISDNITHFMRYIIPMLEKLRVLNETLRIRSHSSINPIEKDDSFIQVKKLLSQLI